MLEQRTSDNFIYSIANNISNNVLYKILGSIVICMNALVLGLGRVGITDQEEK
jgi:hypothetical protein